MNDLPGLDAILAPFKSTSREEWLDLITKDLRGKSLDEVVWKVEGVSIDPFVHADDPDAAPSDIDFPDSWEIAEYFKTGNSIDTNQLILEALEGGCETLLIEVNSLPDWEVLFNDVYLEMIRVELLLADNLNYTSVEESLDAFISTRGSKNNNYNISLHQERQAQGRLNYENTGNAINDLAEIIKKAINGLDRGAAPTFIIELGHHFFFEIARLRAMRLLWSNVTSALNLDSEEVNIEAGFDTSVMSEDTHQNMISAASIALAAIAGGANRLVIHSSALTEEDTAFHRRIARNVHHLLRMESKFDPLPDPVKGSYYIEKLTRKLVTEAWNQLLNRKM